MKTKEIIKTSIIIIEIMTTFFANYLSNPNNILNMNYFITSIGIMIILGTIIFYIIEYKYNKTITIINTFIALSSKRNENLYNKLKLPESKPDLSAYRDYLTDEYTMLQDYLRKSLFLQNIKGEEQDKEVKKILDNFFYTNKIL